MNAKELSKWIHDEHGKVMDLTERLHEKVAVRPRANQDRWLREVRTQFEHLRAHMVKHMALEEQDGYMVAVSEQRPVLSREIDRLAHEHRELTQIMERIQRELAEVSPEDQLLILDCCRRIQNLLNYLEHHERDENLLILSAFTEDIGTKD